MNQVERTERMVDSESSCIDAVTPVSAVTRDLQTVASSLLDEQLRHCVRNAAQLDAEDAGTRLEEAPLAIARLVRS